MLQKKVKKSKEIKSVFLYQLLLLSSRIMLQKKVRKSKIIKSIFLRQLLLLSSKNISRK